ncbi:MAG: ribonuclease III [Deltaproteobacteria bacterium]|nr:ribonuclease III [Candidatus Tharpella sp.]
MDQPLQLAGSGPPILFSRLRFFLSPKIYLIGELEEILGYSFRNRELLLQALTHKSYVNENRQKDGDGGNLIDNERLEFLGDAVLELLVSEILYGQYPDKPEGELSRIRSQIVNTEALARFAGKFGLGNFLRLGRGEERQGGRLRISLLADAFEALLAALFLDSATEILQGLVGKLVTQELASSWVDYKSQLQERLQEETGQPPTYELVARQGADHRPLFFMEVRDGCGRFLGSGSGPSRKSAEQEAAGDALQVLQVDKPGEVDS